MHTLAVLLMGYSVFSVPVIVLTHFRRYNYSEHKLSRAMGVGLLLALGAMQMLHFAFLQFGMAYVHGALYRILLFAVAPMYYLYSKPLLRAPAEFHPRQILHLLPVVAAPALPYHWALPLAFAVGAGYLLWLGRCVYILRSLRSRFRLEIALLGTVFAIALIVFVLGMCLPLLGEQLFFTLYASAIGCAFLLVGLALGLTPRLSVDVAEAVRDAYAVSTLTRVDGTATLEKLEALMSKEHRYQQPTLDLPTLAAQVGLSAHQLSELINTRLGKGFSRYLREYRIEAARKMLLAEPSASVLSIGLSVGFTSQSNFYEAFREITGMTPGRYRKLNAPLTPER